MLISFKTIRVITLIVILLITAGYTFEQRLTSRGWSKPLQLIIYPINADGNPQVDKYISVLEAKSFKDIDKFFRDQGEAYYLGKQPVITNLGPEIEQLPPPRPARRNMIGSMIWSLNIRYWAWRHTPSNDIPGPQVRMFVMYHKPVEGLVLPHSSGLAKGLLGIVHAFASKQNNKQNNVVIAHEFLHTVGAIDKYNHSNYPIFPNGFADINRTPLLPQFRAEIMAGRIPITKIRAEMPKSLAYCMVGKKTAGEVNWAQLTN